jgi:hypothetical protein
MDGPEGFDLSKGTWKRDGWNELDELRKKLEDLKELRELVRSLGRGGGKGPLRLAPEEVSRLGAGGMRMWSSGQAWVMGCRCMDLGVDLA